MLVVVLMAVFALIEGQEHVPTPTAADTLKQAVEGSSVNEWRGYYKREHSLIKPYQGELLGNPCYNLPYLFSTTRV